MGESGWHAAAWKACCAILRGEPAQRPPVGYLPDRGRQKQRNHRMLGAAWHLLARSEHSSLVEQWVSESTIYELENGLGTYGGAVEINMPDPHAPYEILPRLVFLLHAIKHGHPEDEENLRQIWRWQIAAWQAGSTPDGQVVLPCTRLVTPLSQATDACNRFLLGLPHRNNKWEARTWAQWFKLHRGNPTAGLWAAEFFRRALAWYGGGDAPENLKEGAERLFHLASRPDLEPPLYAWPVEVERSEGGHKATMYRNPKFDGIEPCFSVSAIYARKSVPTAFVGWSQKPAGERGAGARLAIREAA